MTQLTYGCIQCEFFESYTENEPTEPIGRCLADGPIKYQDIYGEFSCSIYEGPYKTCVMCANFNMEQYKKAGGAECLSHDGPQQGIYIEQPLNFVCSKFDEVKNG